MKRSEVHLTLGLLWLILSLEIPDVTGKWVGVVLAAGYVVAMFVAQWRENP